MYSWALTSIVSVFKSLRITMAGESQSVHERQVQARIQTVLKLRDLNLHSTVYRLNLQ